MTSFEPIVSTYVRAHSLRGRADLNGRTGQVTCAVDAKTGRVGIKFVGEPNALSIKVDNMAPIETSAQEVKLLSACLHGDVAAARALLDAGTDVLCFGQCNDKPPSTPLHNSCLGGHIEIAELLLQRGSAQVCFDHGGARPIHMACALGRLPIVRLLIESSPAALAAEDMNTLLPMHVACIRGKVEIVKLLMELGAALDTPVLRSGRRPIHFACVGGHVQVADYLHSGGAALDVVDNEGMRPCHHATNGGHKAMLIWLASMGAQVDFAHMTANTRPIGSFAESEDQVESVRKTLAQLRKSHAAYSKHPVPLCFPLARFDFLTRGSGIFVESSSG